MAPSKKKKAPTFLTDESSLAPYKVQVVEAPNIMSFCITHPARCDWGQDTARPLIAASSQAKDLIKTSLGLTASVVGVKHSSKEGEEMGSGTLWVDYRWGYRSPVDKDRFEPCYASVQLWKSVHEFEQMLEDEETMREKIHKLNELFKLGLLNKDKKKK